MSLFTTSFSFCNFVYCLNMSCGEHAHHELWCRDQLYFVNISLCIFDEVAAGFHLDGKFLEPRSDDTLAQLTGNLEKQRKGSIQRSFESQMLFVGKALFESYSLRKAEARRQGKPPDSSLSGLPNKTARSVTAPLKQALEEHVTVRAASCTFGFCSTFLSPSASVPDPQNLLWPRI
jgi:hypothetical protein